MYTVYEHINKINGKNILVLLLRIRRDVGEITAMDTKVAHIFTQLFRSTAGIILNIIYYFRILLKKKHVEKNKN